MAPAPDPVRIVVLVSGSGSNLQALIDAASSGRLGGSIVGVISNRRDAYGVQRAETAQIATSIIETAPGESRADYDARLADAVSSLAPDLVVLAGWMRLLTGVFLDRFPHRVINLHPALPGEYPGLHAIERALADAERGVRDHTGVMVHLVPDEGVDDGPVLASAIVPIASDDTIETLTERVHNAEHALLTDTVAKFCESLRSPSAAAPAAEHPPHFPLSSIRPATSAGVSDAYLSQR